MVTIMSYLTTRRAGKKRPKDWQLAHCSTLSVREEVTERYDTDCDAIGARALNMYNIGSVQKNYILRHNGVSQCRRRATT